MTPLVPITLFGFLPFTIIVFSMMPPRRAVLVTMLSAWLFLPMAAYPLSGFPDYSKLTAPPVAVLLSIALFDAKRLQTSGPKWYDLPVIAWCLAPFPSSVLNGLGVYDGISTVSSHTLIWGIPYWIGRMYFGDREGLRELAFGLFIGGLVYVPFCAYEMRMAPVLHTTLYGFHQHSFMQARREGGWRPTVFLQHGLMVGMWMVSASVVGFWFWMTKHVQRLRNIPIFWLAAVLITVAFLCRSFGASALMCVGIGSLLFTRWAKLRLALAVMAAIPFLYTATRATGVWSGQHLITISAAINPGRASSLETRIKSETILRARAIGRPVFGWGSAGAYRLSDRGESLTVPDGMWIVMFGKYGMVGLTAVTLTYVLPGLLVVYRWPARYWRSTEFAPAASLAVVMLMVSIDNLFNAMINPIHLLVAGGLCGIAGAARIPKQSAPSTAQPLGGWR